MDELREELAAAKATLREQKWLKMLAGRVTRQEGNGRRVDEPEEGDAHVAPGEDDALGEPRRPLSPSKLALSVLIPSAGGSDELIETLDPRYFTESFDAVANMLSELPSERDELDLFLQTEISAVDIAMDVIVARLAEDVRANHDAFIQGMKQVQDVDLDLVRAQIHVKNGRRLLTSTRNDLIRSSLEIVKMKRNRDRVESIIDLGSKIVQFFEEEEKMNDAMQQHSFTTAVNICLGLRRDLSAPEMQSVTLTKKLVHRVKHFLPELRSQFDKSLRKVAEGFDPVQYKELLQAYITLADQAENLGFEFSSGNLSEVLSNIPEILVRCIDEITRQYLVDLFGQRASPKKNKSLQQRNGITSQSESLPSSSAVTVVDNVRAAFQRLTDLMHTFYLLVQWHRDPFNPRNDSLAYLHRCGIDDDDDDDDEDDGEEYDQDENERRNSGSRLSLSPTNVSRKLLSPRRRRSSSISSDTVGNPQRSPYSQVLCETGMTLLRYRKIVWENMQQDVIEALERLDMTSGLKLEHIIDVSQMTSVFIDVGEEFTGTASTKLRSVLRLKCEQYITFFHEDNLELIRMLIDRDTWQRVLTPTSVISRTDDILRLIEKRSGYKLDRWMENTQTNLPIHSRNVFPSFQENGNPFSSESCSHWLSSKLSPPEDDRIIELGLSKEGSHQPSNNNPFVEDEFVLTSSSLSGFVRLCGVYLKMMHHLPHNAWEVFLLLIKLFEFNLYSVCTGFIEESHVAELLQLGEQITSPSLFVLRETILSTARQFSSGEIICRTPVRLGQGEQHHVAVRRLTKIPSVMDPAEMGESHAFAERTVAAESIVSMVHLLEAVKPLVQACCPDRYVELLDEVYKKCSIGAHELKFCVYRNVARQFIDSQGVIDNVLRVKWDVPYLVDRHNAYVVSIVRKCGEVWGGLQIYCDGSVPISARDEMWGALVQRVMDLLLVGFSSVPRCSPQGRALMSMDLIAVRNGLDLINHIDQRRVTRGYDHVNGYIKAFYFGEDDLLDWIRLNKDKYSKQQIANLLRHGLGASQTKNELRKLVLKVDAILHSNPLR